MFKTRRKRAVVLALIAFFCATACVSVDWRRFGGGLMVFFKGRGGPVVAAAGSHAAGSNGAPVGDGETRRHDGGALPRLAVATARKHAAGNGAGAGKTEEDLFTDGNPAAGGIPPGSFIVARNDAPPVASQGDGAALVAAGAPIASEIAASPAPGGGQDAGGGVTSPAPTPAGGSGDGALPVGGSGTPTAPTPAPAPGTASPPPPATPTPAPTPTQSGTTDPDGGDSATPAPAPLPPVSAIPEASTLQMMALGALFLAVAAARRRKSR